MSVGHSVRSEKTNRKQSVWLSLCSSWSRLSDIRVVRWTRNLLQTCKGLPVVGTVAQTIESGVNTIVKPAVNTLCKPIVERLPSQVACCADCSVSLVERVDRSCVWVYNKAGQVFSWVQICVSFLFRRLIQSFLHSSLGQALLLLIDLLIGLFEGVLDMIAPELVNEEEAVGSKGGKGGKERGLGTVSTSHKQQRKGGRGNVGGEVTRTGKPFFSRLFSGLIVAPLRALVFVLTWTRHFFMWYGSGSKPSSPTSSLKNTTLLNRRKVSPKKRLANRSYLRRFLMHALHFLGVRQMTRFPPKYLRLKETVLTARDPKSQEPIGLVVTEQDKPDKRRHSDVSSESLSDTDVRDLMQDLDEYVSEEDPDFRPGEDPSDDSLEFAEGDTESFIELEDEDIEPPSHPKRISVQRKDMKREAGNTTPSVQIAADVVKFDKDKKSSPDKTKPSTPKDDHSDVKDVKKDVEKSKQVLQKTENVKPERKAEESKSHLKSKHVPDPDHSNKDVKNVHEKKQKTEGKTDGHRAEPLVNGKADKENQAPVKQLSPKKGLLPQNTSSPKLQQIFGRRNTKKDSH